MLYPNFTALQNLDYFTRLSGRPAPSRSAYRDASAQGRPRGGGTREAAEGFSKGMRQKCGIAIVIMKNAPAILLDEPHVGARPPGGFRVLWGS